MSLCRQWFHLLIFFLVLLVTQQALPSQSFLQQCSYYFGKLHGSEFLDTAYVVDMGLLRAKVFSDGFKHALVFVPIEDLILIHSIDYDHSVKKLMERAHDLTAHRDEINSKNQVSLFLQEQVIPSKNPIRAIRTMEGKLVVFDGNGRLESIRVAFSDNPKLKVEVDVFQNSSSEIDAIIRRIRSRNGLELPVVTVPSEISDEATHFYGLLEQYRKAPNSHLEVQMLDGVSELSAELKRQILNDLKKRPIKNRKVERELKLLLYDEIAWDQLLDRALRTAGDQVEIASRFRLAGLLHMPDDLRAHVLKRISEVYPHLSKSRAKFGVKLPVQLTKDQLAPKRFADFVLRNLIRADQIIGQAVNEEGRSSVEALQKYFSTLQEGVLRSTGVGNYSALDVQRVARVLQRELIQWAKENRVSHPKIIIGGSFPGGRARLESSDLDVRVDPPELAKRFSEFERAIRRELGSTGTKVDLHLEEVWPSQGVTRLGVLNPVLMNITPEQTELWVYPPLEVPKHDQNFEWNLYPEPKIYILN